MTRGRSGRRAAAPRLVAVAGVALTAVLALAGCGARGGDGGAPVGSGTSTPPAATATSSPASSTPAASSPGTAAPRQDESPSPAPAPAVDQADVDAADAVLDGVERSLDAIDQEMAQDE